jgi:YVTN family beta-propeller protein
MTLTIAILRLLMIPSLLLFSDQTWLIGQSDQTYQVFAPLIANTARLPALLKASWGSPIAISPKEGFVWSVNPDSGTVSVLDADKLSKVDEIAVGGEPWSLAFMPNGDAALVVDRAGGRLVTLNATTRAVQHTLEVGPEPIAVAIDPYGKLAYISISANYELAVVDIALQKVTHRIAIAGAPYAVATDGEFVYVTHVFAQPRAHGAEATDDGREGRISVINAKTNQVVKHIVLEADAHGFPNMLASIALTRRWAWVPHVRAAPAQPNGLTTTVFAAVASIDRNAQAEDASARLLLNDDEVFGSPVNNPIMAVPAPDEKTLYVVAAGSDTIEVIDIRDAHQPRLTLFLPGGQNPRGMVISADGKRGYVMSFLSRAVTVLDLEQLRQVATVTVTNETLSDRVLRGKHLFNTAIDLRMSKGGWISCASCHLDGGTDSVTWIFPDGPRQSPPLWNVANTLPFHWSAALDEAEDVDETIRVIQDGAGLAPNIGNKQLGIPNAGRSEDLGALAAFVYEGIRVPAPPTVAPENMGDIAQGRQLFIAQGCAACHGGPNWTISTLPGNAGTLDTDGNGMVDSVLREVGTVGPLDLRGAKGFDVPSLVNAGLTKPYLHDGRAPTLESLIRSGHPLSGTPTLLTTDQVQQVVAFVSSIGIKTQPISVDQ